MLCSSCGFLFLREYFVWILFNIPTPFNKRRASLVKCVLGLLVWHSLHVVVEGSQRCYLVSNLSTSIKYLSSPRPSRKGNLLFQCEGSEQDSKTYRISQLANCTSTQSQPNTKKRTVPCRQYPRSQQSSSTALSYREMRRTWTKIHLCHGAWMLANLVSYWHLNHKFEKAMGIMCEIS